MAKLKVANKPLKNNNKVISNKCKEVSILNDKEHDAILFEIKDDEDVTNSAMIEKGTPILVEVKGNVEKADVTNTLVIFGDVSECNVEHVLSVEGFIRNQDDENVTVDKTIKVCYGKERCIRSNREIPKSVRKVSIEGDLDYLKIALNKNIESVIIGNVNQTTVGNTLGIKGTLENYNINKGVVYTTSGESTAPSLKDVMKNSKEREESIGNKLNDLFSRLTFYK